MGVRHAEQEQLERLEAKTLDAQLRQILVAGLACSPFEAEAVLDAVQEADAPFFRGPNAAAVQPGCITLVALAAEEPAGKAVADRPKRTVSLRLHRGAAGERPPRELGLREFRRQRIPELCQQALSQGALLTREDLACRIFLVGLRTLSRDLAWLRAHDQRPLPLRSTLHDIGPVLTHRVEVIRLALEGKTMTEICAKGGIHLLGPATRCSIPRWLRSPDRILLAALTIPEPCWSSTIGSARKRRVWRICGEFGGGRASDARNVPAARPG